MEEKRQKMIALENQRQLAVGINHHQGQTGTQVAVQNIGHQNVLQPIDIVREINAVNARVVNNNTNDEVNNVPNPPPVPMEQEEENDG